MGVNGEALEGPTPGTVTIRKMVNDDIDTIVAIEKESFTVPWTADAFYNELVHRWM